MQKVYHGSPNGNLKWITPRMSTHGKNCVYATVDKVVALLFMGKGNGDLDVMIATIDGILTLVERRASVFKNLYDQSGYLYELSGDTFHHYDYLWSKEVVSFEPVVVRKRIVIDNILESIFEEQEKGNIKIYQYPNRPDIVPFDNRDLIDKYINFEKNGLTGAIEDMLKIYPEFEKDVKEKMEIGKRSIRF